MKNKTNINLFLVICLHLVVGNTIAQDNKFLEIKPGISVLNKNGEVSTLSFETDQNYTKFHNEMLKKFGKPEFHGYTAVFDSVRMRRWAKDPIVIRYEVVSVKGFDNNWRTIFIMAETDTPEKRDLLQPELRSTKRICRYFKRSINRNFD